MKNTTENQRVELIEKAGRELRDTHNTLLNVASYLAQKQQINAEQGLPTSGSNVEEKIAKYQQTAQEVERAIEQLDTLAAAPSVGAASHG